MTPVTHDYMQRGWGHDYVIMSVSNGGQIIKLMGWGMGLKDGDYILLQDQKDRTRSTRYRLRNVSYDRDPRDMWSATGIFAPRRNRKTSSNP